MIFGKCVNKYYKKYWYYFLIIFISDVFVDLIQLLIPMILGNSITAISKTYVESDQYNTNPFRVFSGFTNKFTIAANENLPFYQTDFFTVIMFILIIGIGIFLGRISWRIFTAKLSSSIEYDIRKEMFDNVINKDVAFFDKEKVGGLMSYFTNDLATIKMCFNDGLIFFTDLTVLGTTSIILMVQLSPIITLITASPLILFIIFGALIGKGESKRYKISNDAFEHMSDFTEENLQGFTTIKSFNKENDRLSRFKKITKDVSTTSISYLKYSSSIDLIINTFLSITFALLFIFCSISILSLGKMPFSGSVKEIGDLSKFMGYYDSLVWPMMAGGMLIDYISRGNGAQKRIYKLINKDDSSKNINHNDPTKKTTDNSKKIIGDIKIQNLSFSYEGSKVQSLKNISMFIPYGSTIGILGKTGSGKSTLVSLISKIYSIQRNQIYLNNMDLVDIEKSQLNNSLSIVLQDSFLFSGTIKENIAFYDESENIDENKVIECAKLADIDKDINSFENKYDTFVKEKGTSLSGGQKQRISIARALYKEPRILILDDSLSAVDADTEVNILNNLKNRKEKITTILITQRISTLKNCDCIYVIENGEIIDYGTNNHLLKNCEFYKNVSILQNLESDKLC